MRVVLPVIYLLVIGFLMAWVVSGSWWRPFLLVFVVGGAVLGPAAVYAYTRSFRRLTRERRMIMLRLAETAPGQAGPAGPRGDDDPEANEEREGLARRAFELFDEDRSGSLERMETARMLRAINPRLSRKQAFRRIDAVARDHFTFDDFVELTLNDEESHPFHQADRQIRAEKAAAAARRKRMMSFSKKGASFSTAHELPPSAGAQQAAKTAVGPLLDAFEA